MSKITRQDLLKTSGIATGAAMLDVSSVQGRGTDGGDEDTVDIETTKVTVTEGTNIAPHVVA